MTEQDFGAELEALAEDYNETKPPSQDPINGELQCVCTSGKLLRIEKEGVGVLNAVLKWKVVTPGEHENKEFDDWNRLVDRRSIGYWKEKMHSLDMDVATKLEDLETVLPTLQGLLVSGNVKARPTQKAMYHNFYINSVDGRLDEATPIG